MTDGVTVALGDGVAGLLALPAGSVGLVLTDPPSGATRAGFDRAPDLAAFWAATWHALDPGGSAVVFSSSLQFAGALVASEPRAYRYDLVWSKSVATGFLNARHRPLRSHEYVLVFCRRGLGAYHPQMVAGATPIHAARRRAHSENYNGLTRSTRSRAGATDRYPTSVLEFASVGTTSPERSHPQQKPVPLLRWLVRTYSDPGALVADPFAGSGSAGVAALAEGRRFAGWDTSGRFAGARAPGRRTA